jgi:CDGSH-type Zn-finger protein
VVTDPTPTRDSEPAQERNLAIATGPLHRDRRRVTVVPGGPLLIEGPVEVVTEDCQVVASDRFVVAVCVCQRSRRYPFCDTSHRRRVRRVSEDRAVGSGRD